MDGGGIGITGQGTQHAHGRETGPQRLQPTPRRSWSIDGHEGQGEPATDTRLETGRRTRTPRKRPHLPTNSAALIEKALPGQATGYVLTIPPQGAAGQARTTLGYSARRVATRLSMPLVELLERRRKLHHGRRASLEQDSYSVSMAVPAAIVVDDLITSGTTMRLSLDALRAAEIPAWGFAYSGS